MKTLHNWRNRRICARDTIASKGIQRGDNASFSSQITCKLHQPFKDRWVKKEEFFALGRRGHENTGRKGEPAPMFHLRPVENRRRLPANAEAAAAESKILSSRREKSCCDSQRLYDVAQ
jgi:hypothetical protein